MKIGQLAVQAGVSLQTIRYYEREGLLPKPIRMANGYRVYDLGTVRQVKFIRHAQTLGFTLAEIQELLGLRVRNAAACAAVARRTQAKIITIEERIHELQRVRDVLHEMVDACIARRSTPNCPLLEVIETNVTAVS